MPSLHEACFQERLAGGEVRCTLCPHGCRVRDGGRGACAVRYNAGGTLYTLVRHRAVWSHVDAIEKKPLFHFYPGSRAYSIATVGCNLRCTFCQNWQISQWPREGLPRRAGGGRPALEDLAALIPGDHVAPADVVAYAAATCCQSVAYTYTEPTVFQELVADTAVLARGRGLSNVLVTNGFVSEAPLAALAPLVDAVNVDLKFFRDESYRTICRARLDPVLDAIRLWHALGVWVEVTTLVIPGLNDSDEELRGIARFLRSLGAHVPWHVSRFHPSHRMTDRPPTPLETLARAAAIGRAEGLRHVYEGNVPGGVGENTGCHRCGALLVARRAFAVLENRIVNGRCPDCGTAVDGVGMSGVGAIDVGAPTHRARGGAR